MRIVLIFLLISTIALAAKKKKRSFNRNRSLESIVCLSNQIFNIQMSRYTDKNLKFTQIEKLYEVCLKDKTQICKNNNAKICRLKNIGIERFSTVIDHEQTPYKIISKLNQIYFPFLINNVEKLKYLQSLSEDDNDLLNISTLFAESKKEKNLENCLEHGHEYFSYAFSAYAKSHAVDKAFGIAHHILEQPTFPKEEVKQLIKDFDEARESILISRIEDVINACTDIVKANKKEVSAKVCSRYKLLLENNQNEFLKNLCPIK